MNRAIHSPLAVLRYLPLSALFSSSILALSPQSVFLTLCQNSSKLPLTRQLWEISEKPSKVMQGFGCGGRAGPSREGLEMLASKGVALQDIGKLAYTKLYKTINSGHPVGFTFEFIKME